MRRGRGRAIFIAIAALLVGVGIGVVVTAGGVSVSRVASSSMSPEIDRGEWVVTRDVDEDERAALERDEIVMFRFPLGTAGRAVKRVAAIEGDEVEISEHSVTVNGRPMPIAGAPSEGAARRRTETVPANHVFLLGDNAQVSIDSRSFGAAPETEVVARVLLVLPRNTAAFLLGLAGAVALVYAGVLVIRRRSR